MVYTLRSFAFSSRLTFRPPVPPCPPLDLLLDTEAVPPRALLSEVLRTGSSADVHTVSRVIESYDSTPTEQRELLMSPGGCVLTKIYFRYIKPSDVPSSPPPI